MVDRSGSEMFRYKLPDDQGKLDKTKSGLALLNVGTKDINSYGEAIKVFPVETVVQYYNPSSSILSSGSNNMLMIGAAAVALVYFFFIRKKR